MAGPTPRTPKRRAYKHVDKAAQAQMREMRVRQLEQEHYSNVLALEGLKGLPESDAKAAQVEQLEANIAQLDAALQALDPA